MHKKKTGLQTNYWDEDRSFAFYNLLLFVFVKNVSDSRWCNAILYFLFFPLPGEL